MAVREPVKVLSTHTVTNQPPPFEDIDFFSTDAALADAVARGNVGETAAAIAALGVRVGSGEVQSWADQANRNPPQLKAFDRYGQRIDEVDFHPAYHALMALGIDSGISSIAWTAASGGHVSHSAMLYLMSLADQGVCCPMSMTYACVPTIRRAPHLAGEWEPRIAAARYDPASRPAAEKAGATIGMAMTEKQGGSDVRSNSTQATPSTVDGGYTLVGHKWFCSAPMSDGFLTLAHTDSGLSCFLVPRWTPDGGRNAIRIMRLKDKLGDRSNASSEIEYHNAWAILVGDEGDGVRTIIDMVQGTRLDCMVGSAAIMRGALANALWHCAHRRAFGTELVNHPAMAKVLADLCVEQEAAVALAFRVAQAFDRAAADEREAAIARVLTPIAKYWVCKRTPGFVYEAMECLGGAGYVEESPLPRFFRQSPLNSIWEGSGNVIALDALRAIGREPAILDILLDEIGRSRGVDPAFDTRIDDLKRIASTGDLDDATARHFVESAAILCEASLLLQNGPSFVADAFIATRVSDGPALTFGAHTASVDTASLIARASPNTDN